MKSSLGCLFATKDEHWVTHLDVSSQILREGPGFMRPKSLEIRHLELMMSSPQWTEGARRNRKL